MNLTCNRVDPTKKCIDQILYLLTRNVERYLNRKHRRVFSQSDQLLVVDNECSDHRRFAQPIRLRVRHVRWQRRTEIFGKKLIPIKCSVDAQSFAGNGSMNAD